MATHQLVADRGADHLFGVRALTDADRLFGVSALTDADLRRARELIEVWRT